MFFIIIIFESVDFLQDVSKILTVASLPLLPLTAVLDVVNRY